MALRNNSFTRDSIATRSDRTLMMQTNIDTWAATIGITGDNLAWAQQCHSEWQNAVSEADVKNGQADEAHQTYAQALELCVEKYQLAKDALLAIIHQYEKPDKIENAYRINGQTPRTRGGIELAIDDLKREHDILVAEVPPDPRVLPDAVVAELVTLRDDMMARYPLSLNARADANAAYDTKNATFDAANEAFRVIFMMAKLVWGDDDPKLLELGFVPKSMIWTHNRPYAPKNLAYDDVAGKFTWDAVEDVDSYELSCRLHGTTGDWTTFWTGDQPSTTDKPAAGSVWDVRCRAIAGEHLGFWCAPIEVDLTA